MDGSGLPYGIETDDLLRKIPTVSGRYVGAGIESMKKRLQMEVLEEVDRNELRSARGVQILVLALGLTWVCFAVPQRENEKYKDKGEKKKQKKKKKKRIRLNSHIFPTVKTR